MKSGRRIATFCELLQWHANSNGGAIKAPKKPITTVEKPAIIRLLVAGLATCKAHSGPSNANATVESQLAACAIVGREHIIVSDHAKTATHMTPIASRAISLSRIVSLFGGRAWVSSNVCAASGISSDRQH
jgi:hypothetical protein